MESYHHMLDRSPQRKQLTCVIINDVMDTQWASYSDSYGATLSDQLYTSQVCMRRGSEVRLKSVFDYKLNDETKG